MHQILIVEDDRDLANIAEMNLKHAGYLTTVASSCADAREKFASGCFDLVLMDILLPDGDGRDVCRFLRKTHNCPIIFLSCLDDNNTIVTALEGGGDDYVTKPVRYDLLLARIKAHLRRESGYRERSVTQQAPKNPFICDFKHFSMDTVHRSVIVNGETIELSTIEYAILSYMVQNAGSLLLYDELYSQVWVNPSLGDVRTLMVHISNLRKKIDPNRIGMIKTVRGAGYVFSDL